jgi:hypothetical protein
MLAMQAKLQSFLHATGSGPNPTHPDRMSPHERLGEVAELLALGLVRLRARQSSALSRDGGESWVDFSPDESGHAEPATRWRTRA